MEKEAVPGSDTNNRVVEDPFEGKIAEPCETLKDSNEKGVITIEDDGEDLPDNFFDDFSNNDFMAGLDIVDDIDDVKIDRSDEDINETGERSRSESDQETNDSKVGCSETDRSASKQDTYSFRKKKYSREEDRSFRKRSRSRNKRRSRSHHDKNSEKFSEIKDSVVEGRRNPEKTRRDIQRDKIRCAKDKEAKVFQEQLKVAETGLVPPGTELDVVLKSEKFKEQREKLTHKYDSDMKKNIKSKCVEIKKGKKIEKRKNSHYRSRSKSKERRRRHSRSFSMSDREKSYSPKRRRRKSRSREHHRSRSDRSNSRRLWDNRDIDLRYFIRSKHRSPVNFSPVSDRLLSRSPSVCNISPESPTSEREYWIRNRSYNRFRRKRSSSPISFMKELEIKLRTKSDIPALMTLNTDVPKALARQLNLMPEMKVVAQPQVPHPHPYTSEMHYPHSPYTGMNCTPLQPPSMCPPPKVFHPPLMGVPNDPNFSPMMVNSGPMVNPGLVGPVPAPVQHLEPVAPAMVPVMGPYPGQELPRPPDHMYIPPQSIITEHREQQHPVQHYRSEENQQVKNLFEEKKITLSDFLNVAAKRSIDAATSVIIRNKIKVISKCQHAMKFLEDSKQTGRFFPKYIQEREKREITRLNPTPLWKIHSVRFNYTVHVMKCGSYKHLVENPLCAYLHKMLSILDLSQTETVSIPEIEEPAHIPAKIPDPPPPPKIIKKVSVFVQTDPVKCQKCEVRSARRYNNSHTQTRETNTFDIGTQVSVEDLNKRCATFVPRGILNTTSTSVQSISHLTPAQLLAQLNNEKKEDTSKPWSNQQKKDLFQPGRNFADNYPPDNHPRNMYGSNDKFSDTYRNVNRDSYSQDNSRNTLNMFGARAPMLNKPADSYNNPNPSNPFGSPTGKNRPDMNVPNCGGNFGSSMSDPRNIDPYGTRRIPEGPNPGNYGNWNMPTGRGNPRGFLPNNPMQNKYFNPHGPH